MKYPLLRELENLVKSKLAGMRSSYTTADGNAGGTTLLDAGLIGAGANAFVGMTVILAPDSILTVDSAEITAFTTATGQVTLNKAYKGGQIVAGIRYFIITDRFGLATLGNIFNIVNAILVLTETGGTFTTTGAEDNMYVNDAPSGIFEPICVKVDLSNQAAGDTTVLRTYYRIVDGGVITLQDQLTLVGIQLPQLINIDLEPNRFGIQTTIELTAGANFALTWEVCYKG